MRILLSTNDSDFAAFLERTFQAQDFHVDSVTKWTETQAHLENEHYDVALLDISGPGMLGAATPQQLRGLCPLLPILVLISRTQMEEGVCLTDMGADDFAQRNATSAAELVARTRALAGRGSHHSVSVLRVQDLELDPSKRRVLRAGKRIHLTSKEYSLLEYLMRNAGSDVTREQIIDGAWNLPITPQTNVVEVYINYLRKKIDREFDLKLIRTVRGTGYRLLRADAPDSLPAKAMSA